MSVQLSEKKAVSPRVVALGAGVAGMGVAAGVWFLARSDQAPTAPTAPTPLAPATAPASTLASEASVATQLAAQDAARRARLKAATMDLPRGPLLAPRGPVGPVDQSRGGTVARAGRLLRLDVDRPVLGDTKQVCLDAPETDLGVQATCKPLDGWPGRVMCARSDAAQGIELKGPISWRLPCP